MSEEGTTHKVIIAGLDSVGKTSIYKKMVEGADSKELENLAPTKGIERRTQTIMGHQIVLWDLGGQDAYRAKYFENDQTFVGASLLIYVLDVQDKERFDLSLDYLLQILMVIKNHDVPPKVFVLIHKFDPNKIEDLKMNFLEASKLLREVKQFPKLQVSRFPTSIFSEDLDFVFTKILNRVIPNYSNPLFDMMDEVADEIEETIKADQEEGNVIAKVELNLDSSKESTQDGLKLEITQQFEAAFNKIKNKLQSEEEKEKST